MKKNISALAVLFYILIVPITQASPVAGFTLESHFDSFCVSQGCTKDEATGKWESDISEDCEKYCGKHRLGCLSSGKPQLSDLFSGDKKGGGCETSANREPLAKEAMPTISPEIIAMSKPCSEAGCGCEALSEEDCQSNRFCYLRDDQSCATLIGYGVEVEDVFHVPLPYPPYITQGGKPLIPPIDFTWDTTNNSPEITLKDSAAAKVKEPGGYIEWSIPNPGGCFFDLQGTKEIDVAWYDAFPDSTQDPLCEASYKGHEECNAQSPYCKWEESKGCMTLEKIMPKFCGKAFTKPTCDLMEHCVWWKDASKYSFTEERLDLEEGGLEFDDLVWASLAANHRPDWRGVLGQKNHSGHSGNEYVELGTASDDRARGFEPSWVKVKLDGTLVLRVVVQVKAAQSKIMCNDFFPATRAACGVYFPGQKSHPMMKHAAAIHAVLLTEKEYAIFIKKNLRDNIRLSLPSEQCASSTVAPAFNPVAGEWKFNFSERRAAQSSWYANARIKPESVNLCLETSDGCDPLTLDFRKVAAKQKPDSPHCDVEGQYWWEDRNEAEFRAAEYLYLWFPHGYLHLWSIDIYHVPKHYDMPGKKTYDFQDAVRVKERMRKVRDVFEHRPYSDWKRWEY